MSWLFGFAAAMWFLMSFNLFRHLRNLRNLPSDPPSKIDALPGVAVVLAARDEAERIEGSIRSLLDHGPPIQEVIVVDDRSTDGTSEILAKLAAENPKLRVVRVDQLPERWLGKTHALQLGAQSASAPWVLFTDADVWMKPGVVGRALQAALDEKVEHVCLFPSTTPKEKRNFLGDAFVLTFGIMLVDVMSRVNRDHPCGMAGIGAFNLLRTDLYRSFGGHEQLRLEIADDMMLGVLVRRAGARTRALMAPTDVECDYASGPFSLLKRLEKNHFAAVRFKSLVAIAVFVVFCVAWLAAVFGPWTGNRWGIAAGIFWLATMFPVIRFAKKWTHNGWAGVLFPVVIPLLGVSMLNSMVRTLWQGGVWWRDTFYPLKMLRDGCLSWSPLERLAPEGLNSPPGSQQ